MKCQCCQREMVRFCPNPRMSDLMACEVVPHTCEECAGECSADKPCEFTGQIDPAAIGFPDEDR